MDRVKAPAYLSEEPQILRPASWTNLPAKSERVVAVAVGSKIALGRTCQRAGLVRVKQVGFMPEHNARWPSHSWRKPLLIGKGATVGAGGAMRRTMASAVREFPETQTVRQPSKATR